MPGVLRIQAELIALSRVLELTKNKRVTIYTDLKHAFLVLHTCTTNWWTERGYHTSKNTPIRYKTHITRMHEAINWPKEMAVVECKGHQKGGSEIIRGNQAASWQEPPLPGAWWGGGGLISGPLPLPLPKYTEKDKHRANEEGVSLGNSWWYLLDEILAILQNLQCKLFKALHDSSHLGQVPYKPSVPGDSKVKGFFRLFNE